MQGQITEQISRLQANGEVPEATFIKKLKEATEKLAKYQTLSSKLLQQERLHMQHQMNVTRFLLKSIRLGIVHPELYESFQILIDMHIKSDVTKIRCLALESLGLLMIQNKTLFEEKLPIFMEQIESENQNKIKSDACVTSLKCILDGVMIHGFLLESGNVQDLLR